MDKHEQEQLCKTYWDIWKRGQRDPEYACLRVEMEKLEARYESILAKLPEQDRKIIALYVTCRETMSRRMLEFACGELSQP